MTSLRRAALFALMVCGLAAFQPSPERLRVYVLDCGHLEGDLTAFGSEGEYAGELGELTVTCFLVRHPRGDLLWDAGLNDGLNADPEGQSFPGGRMTVPQTLTAQMQSLGIAFDEIDYFAASHAHYDHIGNAGELTQATFLIHADEHAYMFGENVPLVPAELTAPLKDAETVTYTEDYDVFGDASVVIVPAPGHTPGHSVLRLDLARAGVVYLSGDLYHLIRSRTERIVPAFNFSKPETVNTIKAFEERVTRDDARVIVQHSVVERARLPVIPAYLD